LREVILNSICTATRFVEGDKGRRTPEWCLAFPDRAAPERDVVVVDNFIGILVLPVM
jgi:hypothetical protein